MHISIYEIGVRHHVISREGVLLGFFQRWDYAGKKYNAEGLIMNSSPDFNGKLNLLDGIDGSALRLSADDPH